jgi:hypothetical protein
MLRKIWRRLLHKLSANKKSDRPSHKSDRPIFNKNRIRENYLTMPKTDADSEPVILSKAGDF